MKIGRSLGTERRAIRDGKRALFYFKKASKRLRERLKIDSGSTIQMSVQISYWVRIGSD